MLANKYIKKAADLKTTYSATRAGFLEYALRKGKEAVPFIDKARALKVVVEKSAKIPNDLLKMQKIKTSLYEAAGISVKALSYLKDSDLDKILTEFIDNFLIPAGDKFIDELVYRYLLTNGDALGGKMRNLVGRVAEEKLTRCIISQLQVNKVIFKLYLKTPKKWVEGKDYKIDYVGDIRSIQWINDGKKRQIIYNLTVPIVKKNIDIVMIKDNVDVLSGAAYKELLKNPEQYIALGELKGGIDPAGADEHWKTANTALTRARQAFVTNGVNVALFFIGAAIEKSMAKEIFKQYESGKIKNCANLNVDTQLSSLCQWLTDQ